MAQDLARPDDFVWIYQWTTVLTWRPAIVSALIVAGLGILWIITGLPALIGVGVILFSSAAVHSYAPQPAGPYLTPIGDGVELKCRLRTDPLAWALPCMVAIAGLPVIAYFRAPDARVGRIVSTVIFLSVAVLLAMALVARARRGLVFTPDGLVFRNNHGVRGDLIRWTDITGVVGGMRPVKSVASPIEIHVRDQQSRHLDAHTLTADDNSLFSTLRYLHLHTDDAAELIAPEMLSALLTPPPQVQRRGLERGDTIPRRLPE